ncbi:MAG: glycosyltransferase family 4 protein [Pseudomonadota bacterium]
MSKPVKLKTLVAFPSTAIFGQNAALAFHERGTLDKFMTGFAYDEGGPVSSLLKALPGSKSQQIIKEMSRRRVTALSQDAMKTHAFWEIVRTAAARAGASPTLVDRIWEHMSKDFTRAAGKRLRQGANAIYAYEYTALEAFEAATKHGAAKILDFPSLNSRQFETLQRQQKADYPELRGPHDDYFEQLFETRQGRRDEEMNAADIIITNSSVTRQSHIDGGANPDRTYAVPYGAPPALPEASKPPDPSQPLRVLWAGTFNIRKGAHLLLQALRDGQFGSDVVVDAYGAVPLPERLLKPAPKGIEFHGSVVQTELFAAFEAADVLMFPTLSDGFGMVVTEAFARGLPVISTNQAGASDLIRDGENGLIIEAGNPDAIRTSIEWCCNNREQLGKMRQNALETARNWQWSDYRKGLYDAVTDGLGKAGFEVEMS